LATIDPDDLLEQQIAFYRADAMPYEAWWHEVFERGGGGARGAACRRDRHAALAELTLLAPHGDALELAAGTGAYTAALLESADHVTAIDASPESLALARAKLAGYADRLTLVEADLFRWRPPRRYATIFFAYWLSHVPSSRFEAFWRFVSDALAPRGQVFFIDTVAAPTETVDLGRSAAARSWTSSYRELDDFANQLSRRELNGRVYHVVKVAWSPSDLELRLAELGWRAQVAQGELSFWGIAVREGLSSRVHR